LNVTGFKQIPNDISANRFPRLDANDNTCALIKVLSALDGLGFESNVGIVGNVEKKVGEYWIYVSPGERRLSFWGSGYMRYNFNLPEPTQAGKVYQMIIIPKGASGSGIATGFIYLKSEPPGASVWIDDEYMGITPFQKFMAVGFYTYRLEMDMYHPKEGNFTVRVDETTTEDIKLNPSFGSLTLTTTPAEGASITLDGKPTTLVTPHTFHMLSPGKHIITLRLENYEPVSREFEINENEVTTLEIPLNAMFGNLVVTTEPLADIYIDNIKVGTGNYTGILEKGMHTIEVRHDKYHNQTQKLDMDAGTYENIDFKLEPITGDLSIITNPPEAEIFINNKSYGPTPRVIKDLLIGTYEIELRKKNYASIKKEVVINEGQRVSITENLDNFKEITIISSPTGANLSLNGKSEGSTPQTLTTNFGKKTIRLTKTGYNDLQETLTVTDQQDTYNFTMISDQKAIARMDFDKFKRRKNWWLTGTLVSGAIGGYFLYSAEKHYKDYQTEIDEDAATDLHDKIENEDKIWPVALGMSGICAVFTTINFVKQIKAKKQLNISLVPVNQGGLLSLKMKF
nr:PEGA domain-containing protein [Bacteroidota bacterium]